MGEFRFRQILSQWITVQSLGWLVLGNLGGVLLAIFLLWPEANRFLAPFTYGRWIALHLDFHLYGWCSFPLLAMLFHFYLPKDKK